jgi:hypothetical protein
MDAMQQQAMAPGAERRRQIRLKRIEAALQRIDRGDFGYCAKCWSRSPHAGLMIGLHICLRAASSGSLCRFCYFSAVYAHRAALSYSDACSRKGMALRSGGSSICWLCRHACRRSFHFSPVGRPLLGAEDHAAHAASLADRDRGGRSNAALVAALCPARLDRPFDWIQQDRAIGGLGRTFRFPSPRRNSQCGNDLDGGRHSRPSHPPWSGA